MSIRIIDPFDLHASHDELAAWLEANGLDVYTVAEETLVIEQRDDGTKRLWYAGFVLTPDGAPQPDPRVPNRVWRERRSTPLLTEPPSFGGSEPS